MRLLRWLLSGGEHSNNAEVRDSPVICFGREELREAIVTGARHCGCVLLFGGRQSGKTTVLRAIERDLSETALGNTLVAGQVQIPVYVDLMRLPYDATPVEFFELVSRLARQACSLYFEKAKRLSVRRRKVDCRNLEAFRSEMLGLRDIFGQEMTFIFLLDEAKRVLGTRFPRGFQDNLFTLMFGSAAGPYSFVLVGAQELYKLSEDSTSPIGSRAAKQFVGNLSPDAVERVIRFYQPGIQDGALLEQVALTYSRTGGHAGLSAALARRFADQPGASTNSLSTLAESVRAERSELFQMWIHNLSPEARIVGEALIVSGQMTIRDVATHLRTRNFPSYRADRVAEELQFTGVARMEDGRLVSVNAMYVETVRSYVVTEGGTARDQEVWVLIRECETGLRRLIRAEFERKWSTSADDRIKSILGEQASKELLAMRARNEKSYPRTTRTLPELLDCAYLGQLGELMKANVSWELFRDMFRDRRELEDMLRDVTPVRNDFAHFRVVPDRELDRCKLRCEDLLAILTRRSGPA